jgi:cysteine-rich repeat protein
MFVGPAASASPCDAGLLGDIDENGVVNVLDVQCGIHSALYAFAPPGSATFPGCLGAGAVILDVDLNCTGATDVGDILLLVQVALNASGLGAGSLDASIDANADGCPDACITGFCGDGVVGFGEACDDGVNNSDTEPNVCRTDCTLPACGDGVVDGGEGCDGGPDCSVSCELSSGECGNSQLDPGEQCDGESWCNADCTLGGGVPAPGQLVVTEFHAWPSAVEESGGEWVEIANLTGETLELSGLELRDDGGEVFVFPAGVAMPPGTLLVVGSSTNMVLNGGAPVEHAWGGFSLANDADSIVIASGSVEIDRVEYGGSTGLDVAPGVSLSLGILTMSAEFNDLASSWCPSPWSFGAGDLGSPGMYNDFCPECGNGWVEAGESCDDGNTLPGDGCEPNCSFDYLPECGNGILDPNEECDDGAANSDVVPDACRNGCVLSWCGDGVIDSGEECDGGAICDIDTCLIPTSGGTPPGALVITEMMIDPVGDDEQGEWFEVYNASSAAIDLDLWTIQSDTGDLHVIFPFEALVIEPGGFRVLGNNADPATNGGVTVDYEYQGISLADASGALTMVHVLVVDTVNWDVTEGFEILEGVPLNLGSDWLDASLNDDGAYWCPSEIPGGSPGGSNAACPWCGDGIVEGIEECDDGPANSDQQPNVCRTSCLFPGCGDLVIDAGESCDGTVGCSSACATLNTQPGDLVISEVMVVPGYAPGSAGEWLEVTNLSPNDIDLAQFTLQDDDGESVVLGSGGPVLLAPGQFHVFGVEGDPALNGGVPVDTLMSGFSLDDGSDEIVFALGGVEIDRVNYGPSFPFSPGASMSLDPAQTEAASNDDADAWCAGVISFGFGDLGTPGSSNTACPDCGNGVFELGEQCDQGVLNSDTDPDACRTDCTLPGCGDGVVDAGEFCDSTPLCGPTCTLIDNIAVGDLVVTEVMVDPAAVPDAAGEWIEIFNTSNDIIDLNGFVLLDNTGQSHVIDSVGPLLVQPATRAVIAASMDPAANGGVLAIHAFDPGDFSLNSSEDAIVLSFAGVEIDRVEWDAMWPVAPGVALSLTPGAQEFDFNDDVGNWCLAQTSYGAGDLGTPGWVNPECPVCGNGVVEGAEACDDGNVSSADGCEPDCTLSGSGFCGDGIVDSGEDCDDGVFNDDEEPDACRTNCQWPGCGDGVVDTGEICDGSPSCLEDCTTGGAPLPGDLVITEIMISPNGGGAQWVELHNLSAASVLLDGLILTDDDEETHVIAPASPLWVSPGGHAVLGSITPDPGGAPIDYAWSGFSLLPGADVVALVGLEEELDLVEYDVDNDFPDPTGASLSLDPWFVDPAFNDLGYAWCQGAIEYGSGGFGTPGAANQECPICGDEVIGSGEQCDDGNFWSGDGCDENCQLEGSAPGPGDLIVSEIMQNPAAVEDGVGEWFELTNPTAETFNLSGLILRDEGADWHEIDEAVLVLPGEHVVLGVNGDVSTNGGVEVDHVYSDFALFNGSDQVILEGPGGIVDLVSYDNGATFPDPNGAAMMTSATAAGNDDGGAWCVATTPLPGGDLGTPGAPNPPCP